MIADGWSGLLFFLLLVAPGLLYDLRARRWRISWRESSFTEVSRVALSSLAFSGAGLVVAVVAWQFVPSLHFQYAAFALDDGYRTANIGRALILLTLSTGVACGLAWWWDYGANRKAKASGSLPTIRPDPEWKIAFRHYAPPGTTAFVKAIMVDGSSWLGWVATYTTDTEDSRAVILAGPLAYRRAGDAKAQNLPEKWSRVILEGAQISSIVVQYRVRPPDAEAADC